MVDSLFHSALVLFDIDGTLIRRAGPHHKQALIEGIRLVTDLVAAIDHIPTHGMLDCTLLEMMLREAGHPEPDIEADLPAVMAAAQQIYVDQCRIDLRERLCPGVETLLSALSEAEVPLGLVTGNLSAIAWRKMELCGLSHFFLFGAFAEQASTRSELAAAAIRRARSDYFIREDARISLVGDHPNDIRAAHANRIRAVASATGLSSLVELRAENPDLLVHDFAELTVADFV